MKSVYPMEELEQHPGTNHDGSGNMCNDQG